MFVFGQGLVTAAEGNKEQHTYVQKYNVGLPMYAPKSEIFIGFKQAEILLKQKVLLDFHANSGFTSLGYGR